MRKNFIVLLAALSAVACNNDSIDEIRSTPIVSAETNLSMRASMDFDQTRIATDDGLTFTLEQNSEEIGVYIETEGISTIENVKFTAGAADDNGWVSFLPSLSVHVQSTSKIYAYAPYSATQVDFNGSIGDTATETQTRAAWSGTRVVELPSLQTQSAANEVAHLAQYYAIVATPASPAAMEAADSYSVDLQFSGVFSLVKFVVQNDEEEAITVSELVLSSEQAALTGLFALNIKEENPKFSNTGYAPQAIEGKSVNSVTVKLEQPVELQKGEQAELYAVVNAATLPTAKIEVFASKADNTVVYTKELADKTISRQQRAAFGVKLSNGVTIDPYAREVAAALKSDGEVTISKSVDLSSVDVVIPTGVTVSLVVPEGVEVTVGSEEIVNNGDLTISGAGTITAADDVITNNGTLTLNGGKIVTTSFLNKGVAIRNNASATAVVNDCEVNAAHHAIVNYGTMTLHGGHIASTSCNQNKDESGNQYYAYGVVSSGEGSYITIDSDEVVINGIQGAVSITNKSKGEISGGYFSTYYPDSGIAWVNFYSLYVAMSAEASISGGHFYAEGNNKNCVYIGNEDIVTATFGTAALLGGYYSNQGESGATNQKLNPAEGCKWIELAEPATYVNPINGKTNTYGYQIKEGPAYDEATKTYTIADIADLKWIAKQTNAGDNFTGKIITLEGDVDLKDVEWTPIGAEAAPFKGTFDGGGNTISNLEVISDGDYVGLFGNAAGGTIKNLVIENVNVKGDYYVAAVAGNAYTARTEDITIKGDIYVEGSGQDIGALTGYSYGNITNVTIDANPGSYVKGRSYFGGVVGYLGEGKTTLTNVHSNIDVIGRHYMIGGITGFAQYGNIFVNCSCSGNVSLTEGDPESPNRWRRIGGIAGCWNDGAANYVVTLTDCEFTGTLSSRNTNGDEVTEFDFGGLVGRGYNYPGTGTLMINGKKLWPIEIATPEQAAEAINAGGKVTVTGAIDKIDLTTLSPAKDVELVLNAAVGEIVLGSTGETTVNTTIKVAKDVDYPVFSVVSGSKIENLTIIGDNTSSKACTSGLDFRQLGVSAVKNVTVDGVRFDGKAIDFSYTADPQAVQNIVIEHCVAVNLTKPFFSCSMNATYAGALIGDITIRNNTASFSPEADATINGIYLCESSTGTILIEGNTITNAPKHGFYGGINKCENLIIRNNTIVNPVEDGIKLDNHDNNLTIENNTITATEYGVRVARFAADKNPNITITGNRIDMSNAKACAGISIAKSEANGTATLTIKENVKIAGNPKDGWFEINEALTLNDGSDIATPFNE